MHADPEVEQPETDNHFMTTTDERLKRRAAGTR
jgi:hypothetical protein